MANVLDRKDERTIIRSIEVKNKKYLSSIKEVLTIKGRHEYFDDIKINISFQQKYSIKRMNSQPQSGGNI